mgnify:CR=1 FL=1
MDSSMFMVMFSALLGHNVDITYLFSDDGHELRKKYSSKTKKVVFSPDYIPFINILPNGDDKLIEMYHVHLYYVVCVERDAMIYVYDPNIKKCVDRVEKNLTQVGERYQNILERLVKVEEAVANLTKRVDDL